jgi:tetratricopeptide (TPR) repeat protein
VNCSTYRAVLQLRTTRQALKNFKSAEDTTPGFYRGNWLYLAKTHYQLSQYKEAKEWLTKLLEHEPQNGEEEEVSSSGHVHATFCEFNPGCVHACLGIRE